jgi:MoaA/NifB/PqqE/SkfB family radical SAM enzyme
MHVEDVSNLLLPFYPKRVILEVTTRCNLHCAYCESSLQQYRCKTKDIDPAMLESVVRYILINKPSMVTMNGHGETTIYKNWHLLCNRLLDKKISLGIISNLAKEFSSEELDTLSRFSSIQASCDTSDPALFAILRRGNTLGRLVENMNNIRQVALKKSRIPPVFSWSCVLCDKTYEGLTSYIQFGLSLGVKSFHFCNYVKLSDASDQLMPKLITELPPDEIFAAAYTLQKLAATLPASGIEIKINPGLTEAINARLAELHLGGATATAVTTNVKMTRNCHEPWYNCMVQVDGSVRPCCTYSGLGRLDGSNSIEDIYDGSEMIELRKGLLTGDLMHDCRVCPHTAMLPVEIFQEETRKFCKSYAIHAPNRAAAVT